MTTPYEISAIGDPQDLSNAFLSTPEASVVAGLSRDYGLVFEFARDDDLALPAGTSADLRWATPLDPASAPSSDPGTAPGTDLVAPDRTTDGG